MPVQKMTQPLEIPADPAVQRFLVISKFSIANGLKLVRGSADIQAFHVLAN